MAIIHKPGTFLRIPLPDGSFGYGRVLELPFDAYYEHRTETPDSDLGRIAASRVLFKISVRHLGKRNWAVIGWTALEEELTRPIIQFTQDIGDFRRCNIYNTLGDERSAEPRECIGLERAAVWEESGVEERLLDTFMGRPNSIAERFKVRLSGC